MHCYVGHQTLGQRFFAAAAIALASGSAALCQTANARVARDVVDVKPHGAVNWTKGQVTAVGTGLPKQGTKGAQARVLAREAAVVAAQRNLLAIVQGIRITSETSVEDMVIKSDVIKRSVQGFIRGARIAKEEDLGDGSYRVTVRAQLYGKKSSLASSVSFGELISQQPQTKSKPPEAVQPQPAPAPAPSAPIGQPDPAATGTGPHSGLLIDCRGLKASRAMGPRILDETGSDVWGFIAMDIDTAEEKGKVGYYTSPEQAVAMGRVGPTPMVVKALRMTGNRNFPSDAVVASLDGERIRAADKESGFLSRLAVGFLVDPPSTAMSIPTRNP